MSNFFKEHIFIEKKKFFKYKLASKTVKIIMFNNLINIVSVSSKYFNNYVKNLIGS